MSDRLRVGYQGEAGAYSEEGIAAYFRDGTVTARPEATFEDVFAGLASGALDVALVPVENSYAGSINETHDLLRHHHVQVYGELILAIRHCLMALPGTALAEISVVYSHPQALAQCRAFLQELDVTIAPVHDTAGAARMVKEAGNGGAAAIAARRAAQLYELEVLASDIQTSRENYTKFYVVAPAGAGHALAGARRAGLPVGPHKTALIMATPDRPGALFECLGALADAGINLTKLESRPRRNKPWEYLFFIDCEGSPADPDFGRALEDLEQRASYLRVLGSFPAARQAGLDSAQEAAGGRGSERAP